MINLRASGIVFLITMSLIVKVYAIQVKVHTSSKHVMALGFTVNGKKYGSLGSSYQKDDAPNGNYLFGIRAGKDIGCSTRDGKRAVKLSKDAVADLNYDGQKCVVKISS